MTKKTLDEQINEDAESLREDVRRLGADLIATLRRARRKAAAPEPEVAAEVAEKPVRPERYPEPPPRRPSASLRTLALFFALGTVAALFLMRRRKVHVAEVAPPDRRRPRWSLRRPRTVAPHTTIETEEYEAAGREM